MAIPRRPPAASSDPSGSPALSFDAPVEVDAFGLSHAGLVRPANEDHFLVARIGRYFETVHTSLPGGEVPAQVDEANYALIVADGMGGHAAGELASRITIRELVRMALALPDWVVRLDEDTAGTAADRSEARITQAHDTLIAEAQREPDLKGMGSTVTAARNLGRMLQVAHVGDSRAYLLRGGRLARLTRDHTYVQMLVDCGAMTREDAARSRARHVLVNAVGGVNETVRVDVQQLALQSGDRVLLCSDGLSDLVNDETIGTLLHQATSAEAACRELVDRALEAGGRDNVTVVVASYHWPDDGTAAP